MNRPLAIVCVLLALFLAPVHGAPIPLQADIESTLQPLLGKYNVPALGGAIVTSSGTIACGEVGFRKRGADIKVTNRDLWHLGSNTKAMTAFLAGLLVQTGKISWNTTIEGVFPELRSDLNPQFLKVNLLQLLSHHAGLKANCEEWMEAMPGTLVQQRYATVKMAMTNPPDNPPGKVYAYSNAGYVIATAMLEKVTGKPWEDLIATNVFQPLKIQDFGFGGTGTPGKIDQPWPHTENGNPLPQNGPDMDNPPVMSPAGRAHMSLQSWGLFIADFLRGLEGKNALAPAKLYKFLTTIPFPGEYALGWIVCNRPWGGGNVMAHDGSNNLNYCVVWMAPLKDFAVLITCNQGGPAAQKACNDAASELIRLYAK